VPTHLAEPDTSASIDIELTGGRITCIGLAPRQRTNEVKINPVTDHLHAFGIAKLIDLRVQMG